FTVAFAAEGPAVVAALEAVVDDFAAAQAHAAMGADIFQRGRPFVLAAKHHDLPPAQADAHRLALELPGEQDGMPVIQHGHVETPQNRGASGLLDEMGLGCQFKKAVDFSNVGSTHAESGACTGAKAIVSTEAR